MKCFGKYRRGNDRCQSCEFINSCQIYTLTEPEMSNPAPSGDVDYDRIAGFAVNIADHRHIPGSEPDPDPEREVETRAASVSPVQAGDQP